ncbi:enoyl-CoA hydratase/isomerase family protein [Frondihabitans cladoniiphilus]|uniref:Enoyl-CoA hydratase-related protein n=1 Tax=Frondihabitans cladoniiphilus TaxID=715785 RepID=A0ABP8VSQ2_9MICO
MTVTLERTDAVAYVTWGDDENRFTADWLDEVDAVLADLAAAPPRVLVSHGVGKFFSNGLVEAEITAAPRRRAEYLIRIHRLLATVTTLPFPTVAAVNGHAFGAGAMLALAHDFRVMNAERGYFCFPEVDIGIPFTDGMSALIQAKLSPMAALEAMTTGRRYGGPAAVERGLVDRVAAPEAVLETAVEFAGSLSTKDPSTLAAIKGTMFAGPVARLLADERPASPVSP